MYAGTPPWDIGRPQPSFLDLATSGQIQGRVLDAGCGTGEHALMCAGLGLDATGVDTSARAIDIARRKAAARGVSARFLQWDALDLPALNEQFDTVLDCGLFHIFDDVQRARYIESLGAVARPGTRYFMLCFSDLQPGASGPRRVTEAEIRQSFREGWRIDAIERATIEITMDPRGVHAWLATITRCP